VDNFSLAPGFSQRSRAAGRAAKKGVVNLYVQSAYVRDAEHASNRPKKKPISFFVILFNTLHNKPIKIQA